MKKSLLKALCNKITKSLLNEVYTTTDGMELEIPVLEVGGVCEAEDGIYTLADGTVITVEGNVIVDLIPAESTEEPALENEGEEVVEETVVPEEEVAQVAEEAVEEVATEVETPEDVEEVAEAIKEEVTAQLEEIVNKYKPMINLVEKCGGMAKLRQLANVKRSVKSFQAKADAKPARRSLEDLLSKVR